MECLLEGTKDSLYEGEYFIIKIKFTGSYPENKTINIVDVLECI